MNQSYRNLIANGIVLQLAVLGVYFLIKAGAGGAACWKLILYEPFFALFIYVADDFDSCD